MPCVGGGPLLVQWVAGGAGGCGGGLPGADQPGASGCEAHLCQAHSGVFPPQAPLILIIVNIHE